MNNIKMYNKAERLLYNIFIVWRELLFSRNVSMDDVQTWALSARAYLRGGGFRGFKTPPKIFRFFFEK